jgi:hypothetical protein
MKRDLPKAPDAVQGPLRISSNVKNNLNADCSEKQFRSNDIFDENHERWVETRVQVLFASVDNTPLGKSKTL